MAASRIGAGIDLAKPAHPQGAGLAIWIAAEAALGVDTENVSGALRLHERCGFRPVQSGAVYRKPFDL